MTAITRTRPQSPLEGVHFVEDFINNDLTTDNNIGEKKWIQLAIGAGATPTFLTGANSGAGSYGVLRTTAAGADGDGMAYYMFDSGIVLNGGVDRAGSGGFAFRVRLATSIANSDFSIGLDSSVTATAPTDGISVQSVAGVLTLRSDSADHGDTSQAFAQPATTTLTSGTTLVVDTWHDIEVVWSGLNGQGGPRYVEAFVDEAQIAAGIPSASLLSNIDNDEDMEVKIAFHVSGAATAHVFDIDFFEFWQYRN